MTDSPFPFKDSKHSHKKKFQRSGSCDSFYMSSHEERLAAQKKIEEFSSTDEGKSHAIESELSGSSVIEDICNLSGSQSCVNVTTFSLKKCKSRILVPYSRLLKLIGWRPLGRDIYGNGNSCGWKAFNTLYVILVLLFVVYGYIYDIMSCQWKLDLKYDVKYVPVATASPYTLAPSRNSSTGANLTTQKINILIVNGSAVRVYDSTTAHSSDLSPSTATCGHIVTTYIIPDLLHFAAYILGLWYFRIGNNENLYALMEKVFLQTANMQTRAISQSTLIARMRSFFIFGFIWVVSSMFLQGLFVYTFGLQRESILTQLYGSQTIGSSVWPWILFVIDLIGVAVANCINLAVVLNYSIQCEMLRYYVNTVGTRLKERSTDLKSAMQNVLGIRESISLLNSDIARMTSLAVIRFGEMFIIEHTVVSRKHQVIRIRIYIVV
ncbi:hypothetical protein EB796_010450 [Bugula neritina]|uniref:Gustatory receptor n=1 Tax=Bugula neritina TaxID=10212 RepID=A0A7J7JZT5_BUGNE|nr:hypothetical protein EB796_010450 [Bugula neritina]